MRSRKPGRVYKDACWLKRACKKTRNKGKAKNKVLGQKADQFTCVHCERNYRGT